MKNIFFWASCILLWQSAFCQETLFLVNGDSVRIRLQEVGLEEIRYTLHACENQAVIHLPLKQVAAIRYDNGYEQHFALPSGKRPATVARTTASPAASAATASRLRLGGPRIGGTWVASGVANDYLGSRGIPPVLTQFGWQLETRFFQTASGQQGLIEYVPMIGGIEQGQFIPSLSILMAFRMPSGLEFGLGPQFYPRVKVSPGYDGQPAYAREAGTAVVLALGKNFRSGDINFPVNLALVPAMDGFRASLVFGFNAAMPKGK